MDMTCIVAAALFAVSSLLSAFQLASFNIGAHFDFEQFQNLDTTYLISEWEWRREHRAMGNAAGWLNAMAWFFLCIPLLQVVWLQSQQAPRMLAALTATAILVVGGAIMELTSLLLYIGTTNAMDWISEEFNLDLWVDGSTTADGIGWKTLEVVHVASKGLTVWVGAMEWLFLSIIFVLLFVSSRRQADRLFCIHWLHLGLFLSGTCFVIFLATIFESNYWWTSSAVHGIFYTINHVILFPAWLLWLGQQLPRAIQEQGVQDSTNTRHNAAANESQSIMESIGEERRMA